MLSGRLSKHLTFQRNQLTMLNSNLNMELEEVIQGKLDAAPAHCDKFKPDCIDRERKRSNPRKSDPTSSTHDHRRAD